MEHQTKQVKVYVCPEPDCGNFAASSSASNLEEEWTGYRGQNGEKHPERAHTRAQCPDCRARGKQVERIPAIVMVTIPGDPPQAPPIPERILNL